FRSISNFASSSSRARRATLAHVEKVELVAVEVAKVAGVKSLAARSRRPLVAPAELECLAMQGVHLCLTLGCQGHHDSVADGRRLLVEGLGDAETRGVRAHRPGDELLVFHHAFGTHFPEQGIVKGRGFVEVVGTDGDVSDHEASPGW